MFQVKMRLLMPDAEANTVQAAVAPDALDWNKLAASLGVSSAEEARRRAYEIAKFVADVDHDAESQLILKTGRKQLELKLNK
jgi:hypothetical protein